MALMQKQFDFNVDPVESQKIVVGYVSVNIQ